VHLARTTGAEVIGVDSNRHAIEAANELARREGVGTLGRFQCADAGRPLPFDDGCFDAVICIDAINHLPDRLSVLSDWHRLLARGGWILFTDHLAEADDRPVGSAGPLDGTEACLAW
jgi:SAM-dependent methyltransferase